MRTNRQQLLSDLHNLELDRMAVQYLHDDLTQISEDRKQKGLSDQQKRDLDEKRVRMLSALRITVNHINRLERLLLQLSPEEQRIVDRMLIHPYVGCAFDLQDELHYGKTQLYAYRAATINKLLRLRYGASWNQ